MQTREGERKKPSNSQDVCVCTTCKCIFRDPRTATPHRNTSDLTLTAGIRLRQLTMSSFLCPRRRDGFIEGEDLREEKGGVVVVERQEERVWPAGYGGSGRRFLFFLNLPSQAAKTPVHVLAHTPTSCWTTTPTTLLYPRGQGYCS